MNRSLIFFFSCLYMLLIYGGDCKSQSPPFVPVYTSCFGGSSSEEFFSITKTSNGGFIVSGLTNSIDGDITQAVVYDTANIYVARCDINGNKLWSRAYGGNSYDKARYAFEDADQNILVIGTTHSSDGDITSTHGNSEMCLIKLNPLGDIIWMRQYGGTSFESGRYVAQLSDGNYLMCGYTSSKNFDVPIRRGKHDGWLVKTDTAGTILWSITYGGSEEDRIRHFVENSDGSIVFVGISGSSDYQCPGTNGADDIWVGKVDSAGNLLWNYQYGGSLDEGCYDIFSTSDNHYIITGYTLSNNGDVSGFRGGTDDGWVLKIDSLGQLVASTCLGGTRGDRLRKTIESTPGKLITVGFSSSSDIDLSGTNNDVSNDYWIAELDLNLQLQWSQIIGGSSRDMASDILFNAADSTLLIAGESNSVNGSVLCHQGNTDIWIVKLATFTGISEPESLGLNIFFDAASFELIINSKTLQYSDISIRDVTGKLIRFYEGIRLQQGENRVNIADCMNHSAGLYIVSVTGRNFTSHFRILLN
jgi:hypothetical protein